MGRPSAFKSVDARARYYRLYDEALALSPVPIEESDIETPFGTTHVLAAGDVGNPALVALHGKAVSSTMWVPMLATLAARHRVLMIDTLGDVNKSVATSVLSSVALMVEWLDGVLDALGVDHAPFVAASTGTWIAANYAMARPQRVERVAMVCPAGIVSAQRGRWLLDAMTTAWFRPGQAEAFVDAMAMAASRPRMRIDPWRPIVAQLVLGLTQYRQNLREPRPVRCNIDRLADSGIPILAVIGRDETLHDGPKMAERLRRRLPKVQVRLVDDANHLIFIDQPGVVAEAVEKFLEEGTPGRLK